MQKNTLPKPALKLVAGLLALNIANTINAQYLTAHFSLGSLRIAARALSVTQNGGRVAPALASRPVFRHHSQTQSMTRKAVQLWTAVKKFNLEMPEQERVLIDSFLDKHQNRGYVFNPQEKTDLVITACNNFPLHLPCLPPSPFGYGALASLSASSDHSSQAAPLLHSPSLPTNKQELENAIKLLAAQYKDQPENLLAALEPLQLSPFMCAENARVAQTAAHFPGETAAPIELQFLFKQVQREVGVPEGRHLPLKYCPSVERYPDAEMLADSRAVYILANTLNHFEVAQRVSEKQKSDAYGWLKTRLAHEAVHGGYNDPYLLYQFAKKDGSLLKKYSQLLLQQIEHRADLRAFETADCFDCVKTWVGNYGPDYLSENRRFEIARDFKREGKICPVHERLEALVPFYMYSPSIQNSGPQT